MNLNPFQAGPLPDAAMRTGFLLIDASNLDETFPHDMPMISCTPRLLTNSASLMPRLIDLAVLTPPQQEGLAEAFKRELIGEHPPVICAWIRTPLATGPLARNISRFLVGPREDSVSVFWRYFDPRVLVLALTIFEPEQTLALLGGILEWHFPWRGRWWHVFGPGREVAPLKGNAPAWPSAVQWKSLENCSVINRVQTQIEDANGTQTDEACLEQLKDIDKFILDARSQLYLEDETDLAGYSWMQWRFGSEFRFNLKLVDAWNQLACGRISWGELMAVLDEQDFRSMKVCRPLNGVQEEQTYATL